MYRDIKWISGCLGPGVGMGIDYKYPRGTLR